MTELGRDRLHEMVGALKAMKAISGYVDAARFSMYKQLKNSCFYKQLGVDWKTFCKEVLKSDQKTVNDDIRMLEELGEPFMEAAERIGLNKRQLLLFGRREAQETAVIEGETIKLGNREFKISELADNEAEFKREMLLYSRELAVVKKELKIAETKLDGIDREHKKADETLLKKIEDLTVMISPVDTPEQILAGFVRIDKGFDDLDTIIRTFAWQKHIKKLLPERPDIEGKIIAIQEQMRSRVDALIRDWNAEMDYGM